MSHAKRIATGYGKEHKWISRSKPGPHQIEDSIPLIVMVRDVLGYADKAREAKKIISDGVISVDKKVRKDPKHGVGLMDVIEVAGIDEQYVVMPSAKGLELKKIGKSDTKQKLCKIVSKNKLSNGKIQLTLHDGTTLLVDSDDYKVNASVVLELPSKKIKSRFELKKGNTAIVLKGKHSGERGKITEVLPGIGNRDSLTRIGEIQTLTDYVFVIGEDKPVI
ncbi:MAG: 30S ribosomal protein S4e [Candidatus Altiarchaeota archaeon]